jgi:hypothetical protein
MHLQMCKFWFLTGLLVWINCLLAWLPSENGLHLTRGVRTCKVLKSFLCNILKRLLMSLRNGPCPSSAYKWRNSHSYTKNGVRASAVSGFYDWAILVCCRGVWIEGGFITDWATAVDGNVAEPRLDVTQ